MVKYRTVDESGIVGDMVPVSYVTAEVPWRFVESLAVLRPGMWA